MYYIHSIWRPPPSSKPQITKTIRKRISTNILNISMPIINTTQITDLPKITLFTSSSTTSTTMKNNRNKIFIPLSISLVSIILCISFSYCICLCLKHYLNMKGNISSNIIEFNRPSIVSSIDSNNISWYTYETDDNKTMSRIKNERRLSNDSVELFRY